MKKLILSIFLVFVSVIVFISCEKDENENDKIAPIISDVRVNYLDTIIYEGVTYKYNRNNTTSIDTLVPGRSLRLSARFQDSTDLDPNNQGLSSYMIKIRYDSTATSPNPPREKVTAEDGTWRYKDSALYITRTWNTIFGKKDTAVIDQSDIFVRDSLSMNTGTRPYQQGEYFFTVYCVDKAGNQDTVQHRLVLMYRPDLASSYIP